MTDTNTKIIAELNDQLRANINLVRLGLCQRKIGVLMQTEGINDLSTELQAAIRHKIISFDKFTADNDPYKEHDFGSVEHEGLKIFWKIDYYAPNLQNGSEDPVDSKQTTRVLTIMLASEY